MENEFPKVVTLFREGFENGTKNPTERPYFCTLCQVSCTSEKAWGSHLNGKKHKIKADTKKKKAMENEIEKGLTLFRKGFENDTKNPTEMPYFCDLCQVSCTSENAWGSHLDGKKHKKIKADFEIEKAKANEIEKGLDDIIEQYRKNNEEVNSTNSTDSTETPYYCAICDFSCGSENTWGLHLNGKIHETSMLQYELSYVPNKNQSDIDTGC